MCDVNCRDEAAVMFVDPVTGLIVIVEDNSTGKRVLRGIEDIVALSFSMAEHLLFEFNAKPDVVDAPRLYCKCCVPVVATSVY